MTYTDYVSALATLLVVPPTDPGFLAILPRITDDAEQRIYRELDFLATRTAAVTPFTANAREIAAPGTLIVLEEVNCITPAGAAADQGARNPLQRLALDVLDMLWPSAAVTGVPVYFALLDNLSLRVAPTPDQPYLAELVGTFRPAPLTQANPATYLSLNLPDLLLAAAMVFAAAYQKNFGAQSDDPRMALSWEATYQERKKTALVEEARKKAEGAGWSSRAPAPLATPPRN